MITVNVDSTYTTASGLWQYDYGQILRIKGFTLPTAVEIHFSLQEKGGGTETRVGTTNDNVTDVAIPDAMLENNNTAEDYKIYAFVYVTDETSGETEYKIVLSVKARPKPGGYGEKESTELFREAIRQVNAAATTAQESVAEAESWAHGREDYPDRAEDNAKYYAEKAQTLMSGAEKTIDKYVEEKKENLKGETGNVFFAGFKVENGRLKMLSDPKMDKVIFFRKGSRLAYKLTT